MRPVVDNVLKVLKVPTFTSHLVMQEAQILHAKLKIQSGYGSRVKIEKINNLLQVDIDRCEQGCAAHYEQYCQHVVTALLNCNNLEQHG